MASPLLFPAAPLASGEAHEPERLASDINGAAGHQRNALLME